MFDHEAIENLAKLLRELGNFEARAEDMLRVCIPGQDRQKDKEVYFDIVSTLVKTREILEKVARGETIPGVCCKCKGLLAE